MRIAILGRTNFLLRSAKALLNAGHQLVFIGTSKAADFYDVGPIDFEELAISVGAKFWLGGDINAPESIIEIKRANADIGISVNWPAVIDDEAIAAFRLGILNAHAGDLPRYRGNACPNWAILNGEQHMGVCIHKMIPGVLDSGPVLKRSYLPLTDSTYIADVYEWLENVIPELFVETLEGLSDIAFFYQPQSTDPRDWLRCYPRRPEDSEIDWRQPVENVLRLIRASSHPFLGAYTYLEGRERVIIWRAIRYDHIGPFLAIPGQILLRDNHAPVIACSDGAIRITELSIGDVHGSEAAEIVMKSLRNRLGRSYDNF